MSNDEMAVAIAFIGSIGLFDVNLLTTIVDAFNLLRGEENIVVVHLRAKRPGLGVIIPFLNEQHAGFRARVRFEGVGVQADNGKNAALFHDETANALVAGIVEPA